MKILKKHMEFLQISQNRKLEIENPTVAGTYKKKLGGFENNKQLDLFLAQEPAAEYSRELPFI